MTDSCKADGEAPHLRLVDRDGAAVSGAGAAISMSGGVASVYKTSSALPRMPLERLAQVLDIFSQTTSSEVLEPSWFRERLRLEAELHQVTGSPLTCLVVGLRVTEPERRLQRDELTAELVRFVRASSRRAGGTDIVSQYKENTTVLLLRGESVQGGMNVARRLISMWETRLRATGRASGPGLAVGLSGLGEYGWRGQELLDNAFAAWLRARLQGGLLHFSTGGVAHTVAIDADHFLRQTYEPFPRLLGCLSNRRVRAVVERLEHLRQENFNIDIRSARRVAERALEIAGMLDLRPEDQGMVGIAALVRDLGMSRLPPPSLSGPELRPHARQLLEEHPRHSADIARRKGLSLPDTADGLVLHHHERVDGTGYPGRLRGESIPLGARIIAIADAYEAMTSYRVYREARSREEARDQLRSGAGSQFDSKVVAVFLTS